MKKIENSECQLQFGEFIRKGRELRGMSQTDLGLAVDLDQSYISKIERGSKNRNIDYVLALKLCQALNLDLREFIKQYM